MKPEIGTIIASHHIWVSDEYVLDPPVWGVVVQTSNKKKYITAAALLNYELEPFMAYDSKPSWHNGNGLGWEYDENEYKIVPDDEVPDEVWAALAKWRLMQ